jgi:hypothetical protein
MRLAASMTLLASALLAGCCATDHCGNSCGNSCGNPCGGCCTSACGGQYVGPGGVMTPQPVPEVAPEPPMEPGAAAPGGPL